MYLSLFSIFISVSLLFVLYLYASRLYHVCVHVHFISIIFICVFVIFCLDYTGIASMFVIVVSVFVIVFYLHLYFYQRVKPHKKKKLRTLAADVTSSDDYESYVSKLDQLPKTFQPAVNAPDEEPLHGRDSSEDEAEVNRLPSNLAPQPSKSSGNGRRDVRFQMSMYLIETDTVNRHIYGCVYNIIELVSCLFPCPKIAQYKKF